MNRLAIRRIRNLSLLAIISIALIKYEATLSVQLIRTTVLTGWSLLVLVLFLASYQLRKKVPVVYLGSSATWMQFHIYVGLLSGVFFLLHTGGRIPTSLFNFLLAASYSGLFLSGLVGLFLTRIVPARLSHRGEEVIFERIPIYRKRIRDEVKALFYSEIEEETGRKVASRVLVDLYEQQVRVFFTGPRSLVPHVLQSTLPRKRLIRFLDYQKKILSETEQKLIDEVQQWVLIKDNLDYAYAMQGCLKIWLFVHVPLTYGLIVFAIFHVILISAFSGGAL